MSAGKRRSGLPALSRLSTAEIRAFVRSFGAYTASYPGSGGDGSASPRNPGIF
jgi:hypothetical protein